jgi:hypothetical protein
VFHRDDGDCAGHPRERGVEGDGGRLDRGEALAKRGAERTEVADLGSKGIVEGPGRVTDLNGSELGLSSTAPGTIVVRIRYSPGWTITDGSGCVTDSGDHWLTIHGRQAEQLRLRLRLVSIGECD